MPNIRQSFYDVKPVLDKRLNTVFAQEAPLYSNNLSLAGRVDCVGVWDNKPAIVDFKTSRKPKKKEWIDGYFMQCCAYAIMWEERTGMQITQLVKVIAGDEGAPVFVENRDNWSNKLLETIAEYKKRKIFGR